MTLDPIDLRLLSALQENAQLTAQELGEMLNLSSSQAGRRRQRLESNGIITGYAAQVDATQLGLDVQAFVQVQMAAHSAEADESFLRVLAFQPEITAAWTLTGEADYLLRVVCADLRALDDLVRKVLLPHAAVARVQSQIVMNQIKTGGQLPLEGAR
ncbi:AsnC family transcriptional regulator [Actibacterium mucosum KCTC 23349]|uniref:AsnC family transcriptional regulator n=1 Tax=Actibacterium mucosum KCTC 23349 TaxID=1454373 RepID=A0A037ZI82_9RHOB|nr:Lrp/AsnC family transcriptional regulator [Actibacterium mucosum]KAJ55262.1 AsnC family transcriptional regulator [Actibacterium mucosum KCTC 23349]